MKYKAHKTQITIMPEGEPIFSERATIVEIDDEAGGPFVVVRQCDDDVDRKIKIDPTEWPMLKSAIDEMFEVREQIGDA